MTTIRKKMISGVALLCTLMLLIGILPTSVFRNNTANAAGSDTYEKSWIYFDASNVPAWQNTDVYLNCPSWGTTSYKMDKVSGTNIYYYDTSPWNNLGGTGQVYFSTSSLRTADLGTLENILGNNSASSAPDNNKNVIVVQSTLSNNQYTCDRQNRNGQTISSGSSGSTDKKYYEADYIYFDISNMKDRGYNYDEWNSQIYIHCSSWGVKTPVKITDTLWGLSVSGWNGLENSGNILFATQNDWNNIKASDYRRTEQTSDTLATAKGKIYKWNGATPSKRIDDKLVFDLVSETYTVGAEIPTSVQSHAGETLYITGTNSTPTVKFYDKDNNEIITGLSSLQTLIGNLTNYNDSGNRSYSVVIPENATQVSFDDGSTKINLSDYNTSTSNAYNITSSSWTSYTEPDLQGSTLYIDAADSGYTAPIKITYGGQTYTMTNVSGTTYRYKFLSSGMLPTKDTPIKISDNNGKNVTLYYNPNVTNNLFNLKDNTWGQYAASYTGRIYFDATLSKLSYNGSSNNYYNSMPVQDSNAKIFANLYGGSNGQTTTIQMTQLSGKDIYKADVQDYSGYKYVIFYSSTDQNTWPADNAASRTEALELPNDLVSPCFYADTSDSVIYDGGTRSGYWDEVNSIRDAETGKIGKDVVQIDNTTNFTKNNSTLYVNSTFYDYYTDYELNGNNRKDYGGTNEASYRNWVNFRQFDQALSDYYTENNVGVDNAIYTGQFQPPVSTWGYQYSAISDTLNLYGCSNVSSEADKNIFYANNNSVLNSYGDKFNRPDGNDGGYYDYATQNIVSGTLQNGLPTSYDTQIQLPYFNEDFLLGNNSKNTKIGDVYRNVAFPFTQKDVNNNGVKYWVFNSADTTLAMKEDKDTGDYFLKDVGNQDWSKNLISKGTADDGVSTKYGFFPFNEYTTAASGKNYNYGFGTKLEFKFRLTNDGTVKDKNNNDVPIEFEFSGDDDVWVFIDDQLVLDVGGDHGRVKGNINFKTLTSTVSKVKKSANNSNEGTDFTTLIGVTSASGSSEEPAVNVLNNTMSGGLPTAANNMSEEHTLTFFYMERGMWESNMKVQFNFPDENQFEVGKVVDKTDVNDMFKDLFDNQSIFDFSIKNLATHYGAKAVESGSTSGNGVSNIIFNKNFESGTLTPASGNTFEHIDSWYDRTNVVHWFAGLDDQTGEYRDRRWGTLAADNNTVVDITNMQYLSFKYYYTFSDTPTLNNMYIQLVDADGDTLGCLGNGGDYLSGKTYGSTNMTQNSWQNIKVDLSKLTETGTFDRTRVQYIRFGYNYTRDIYLDEFVFESSASDGSKLTGFVTKQYDIPDYGSASTNTLKPAAGANYTSSKDNGTTQVGRAYTVDSNGGFALENEETILFRDQFRRGSYISLIENLTDAQKDLFKTSYTVYENGQAVTSFGTGSTVTNGSITSLKDVQCTTNGYTVNDGRTELYKTGTTDGINIQNTYNGTKPSENTLVFRSYSDPDNETTTTKLKVVYTNKVKTNSLTVTKAKAEGSQDLSDKYTFVIEFSNVGGIGLESEHQFITFTLGVGDSKTIEGIPVGTDYKIYEIKGSDSVLQSVTQDGGNIGFESDTYNSQSAYSVNGTISVYENTTTSYTFSNYKKEVVSFELQKKWVDGNNAEITDDSTLPTSINVQLQRKISSDANWSNVGNPVAVEPGYESWSTFKYTFKDLDKYQNNDTSKPYSYQAVEVDSNGNELTDNKITIDGTKWTVSYGDVSNYTQTITNKSQPSYSLTVNKVDGADNSKKLSAAEFTLENSSGTLLKFSGSDGSYQYDTDGTVTTLTTYGSSGSFTVTGLPNGTYTLTETKAPGGYLSADKTYTVTFSSGSGTCTSGGESVTSPVFTYSNNTAALTVSNIRIVLPETGGTGTGTVNYMFIGLSIIMLAGAVFLIFNRKVIFYKSKH